MNRLVEVRTYRLKPGGGARFHALVEEQSLPLVREFGMDVLAYGPSQHDPDMYFFIRAYDGLEHLRASQDAFYGSAAWRQGPREAILALIDADLDAVFWLSTEAIEAIRRSHARP